MDRPRGQPVSIRQTPEPDGSHVITVSIPDHGEFEIEFSELAAVQFVRTLQQGFVSQTEQRQTTPGFPSVHVDHVELAHGASDSGLLVDTQENGRMVFLAPEPVLRHWKAEIDRLLQHQAQRRRTS